MTHMQNFWEKLALVSCYRLAPAHNWMGGKSQVAKLSHTNWKDFPQHWSWAHHSSRVSMRNKVEGGTGRAFHISSLFLIISGNRGLEFALNFSTPTLPQFLVIAWTTYYTNATPPQSPHNMSGWPCYLRATWVPYQHRQMSSLAWSANFTRWAGITRLLLQLEI